MERCMLRARRRIGRCETSARLLVRRPRSSRAVMPISAEAALWERNLSVVITVDAQPCFLSRLRISLRATALSRRRWTRASRTSPAALIAELFQNAA